MKAFKIFLKKLLIIELCSILFVSLTLCVYIMTGDITFDGETISKLAYNLFIRLWSLHIVFTLLALVLTWHKLESNKTY